MMKILSVNVGRPREIFHEGRMIHTGIFKAPTAGRVRVNALNIEGDEQGMRYAASVTALPESWRAYFAERAARNRQ